MCTTPAVIYTLDVLLLLQLTRTLHVHAVPIGGCSQAAANEHLPPTPLPVSHTAGTNRTSEDGSSTPCQRGIARPCTGTAVRHHCLLTSTPAAMGLHNGARPQFVARSRRTAAAGSAGMARTGFAVVALCLVACVTLTSPAAGADTTTTTTTLICNCPTKANYLNADPQQQCKNAAAFTMLSDGCKVHCCKQNA